MTLAELFDAHALGEQFEIIDEDEFAIRCRDCGKDLEIFVADIHERVCPEVDQ